MTKKTIPAEVLSRFTLPSGCRLVLSIEDECESPDGHFASARLLRRIIKDMEWNEWAWCIVTVTVTDGDASGSDSLGGCNYNSGEQFMQSGGYFDDMVTEALREYTIDRARLATKYAPAP